MTEFSGANYSSDFDGITVLLECRDNEYVYISGFQISKILKTDDRIIVDISLMGINMCLYAIMVGEKYTCFLSNLYKFIENDKIEKGILLNATNNNLDTFLYHLGKCGVVSLNS